MLVAAAGCEGAAPPGADPGATDRAAEDAAAERLLARLDTARAVYHENPDDADALIWYGRHLAYAGRYEDAIDAFSEGIERHPRDARFYRHRGHRFITVGELGRAVEDLERAATMVRGTEDVVEPDGMPNPAGIPRSTLHTNIWYHLALARYLQRDFEGAARGWRRGLELSDNDDMRVANADWLWLTLMRLGRTVEADAVLEEIRPDMEILENDAYHRRLLMYRGEIRPDALMPADAGGLALATYGYGLGQWHLLQGDTTSAIAVFRRVLDTDYEAAFGYMASAAELRALGRDPEQDGG